MPQDQMPEDPKNEAPASSVAYVAAGLPIGVGVGTALGVAMDNIALGLAIGIGLGLAFGGLATILNSRDR